MSRQEIYNNLFSAKALFITGILIIPALFFNPNTEFRVIQFLFFLLCAWLCGKKINLIFTFLVIIFIVVFNLIIPYGRVLFSIGIFKITTGALTAGIHRAVTFSSLIMLSKITVRQDLKINGAFGELLSESLCYFSVIMNNKYRFTGKNLITEIDNMMLEFSRDQLIENKEQLMSKQTKPVGYVILIIAVILSWLPLLINYCGI
ncbi:MAG: hypothetical protein FWB86_02150 [Treponema sp.]|nr:hypothetical protein [Treponema sp.]MCL2250963.1 hypothetical protein [Treponema sp.]